MHDALNRHRSIQTIRDCTSILETLEFQGRKLQIRRLINNSVPTKSTHFILTFEDEVRPLEAKVLIFGEAQVLDGQVFYLVHPKKQYPAIDYLTVLQPEIDRALLNYVNGF
ncbi:TPA: hypothetical protein G8N92_005104 [Salmonella enterica]|nr:hypothetical protein [Salmonella enterica]